MFTRKGVFSVHGRAAVMAAVAAVALTAVEPSLALGTSAPAAGTIAGVVPLQQPLLPVLSGPALRSPQPRTAAPIMTITTATMAAARSTTAAVPIITADMAMGASPTTGAIP